MASLLDPLSEVSVLLPGLDPAGYTRSQMDWWCFLLQCRQVLVDPQSRDLWFVLRQLKHRPDLSNIPLRSCEVLNLAHEAE